MWVGVFDVEHEAPISCRVAGKGWGCDVVFDNTYTDTYMGAYMHAYMHTCIQT